MSTANIYVIKDVVADQYTPLFTCTNGAAAKRQFKQFLAGIPDANEADYEMYLVGVFNYATGSINAEPADYPFHIPKGSPLKSEALDYVP